MFRSVIAAAIAIGTTLAVVPTAGAQELVPCAPENGFCRVPYPTRVIYGVPGRSTARDVGPRGIPCDNRTFGDPAPGMPKRCAYVARGGFGPGRDGRRPGPDFRGPDWRNDRVAWQVCARENGFCSFRGTKRVRYGAGGRYAERVSRNGTPCNNRVFGDPAPGMPKVCQVLD